MHNTWKKTISYNYQIYNTFNQTQVSLKPGAVVYRCSSKWVFVKISKISQENTCVGVSF